MVLGYLAAIFNHCGRNLQLHHAIYLNQKVIINELL